MAASGGREALRSVGKRRVTAVEFVDTEGEPAGIAVEADFTATNTLLGPVASSPAADPNASAGLNAVLKGMWTAIDLLTDAIDAMAVDIGNLEASANVAQAKLTSIDERDETIENLTTPASVAGPTAHDAVFVGPSVPIGGYAKAAAPTNVSGDGDHTNVWVLPNGALAIALTAAGALIPGDATNGLDIDVTRLPALVAGSALVGKVDHAATGIGHGVKVVAVAGTEEALAGSTAAKWVTIQAQSDNTTRVAVGATGVDAVIATGTGISLAAGDSITLAIDNLADVFVDALTSGEGVRYIYGT